MSEHRTDIPHSAKLYRLNVFLLYFPEPERKRLQFDSFDEEEATTTSSLVNEEIELTEWNLHVKSLDKDVAKLRVNLAHMKREKVRETRREDQRDVKREKVRDEQRKCERRGCNIPVQVSLCQRLALILFQACVYLSMCCTVSGFIPPPGYHHHPNIQGLCHLGLGFQIWGFCSPPPPPLRSTNTFHCHHHPKVCWTLSFWVRLLEFGWRNAYRRELRLKRLMFSLKVSQCSCFRGLVQSVIAQKQTNAAEARANTGSVLVEAGFPAMPVKCRICRKR